MLNSHLAHISQGTKIDLQQVFYTSVYVSELIPFLYNIETIFLSGTIKIEKLNTLQQKDETEINWHKKMRIDQFI